MRQARFLFLILFLFALPLSAHAAVVRVVIEGISGELLENVRASLSIEREKEQPALSEARIRRLHGLAPDEIRRALQPFGYYRPQIESELVRKDSTLTARYRIYPGPAVHLSEVDLRLSGAGRDDPAFQKLIENFPIRKGDTLNDPAYEKAKRALQDLAAERGYLKAQLTRHEVQVDLERYEARAIIHFDTGPRYRFGPVTFEKTDLSPSLLMRFVPFQTGDPYSANQLFQLQNALADSDYFEQVEVDADPTKATDLEVPVTVRLKESRRNRYAFGIGYGTDTGPRGSASWLRRRINRYGHRLGADAEISQIQSRLTARYVVPLKEPLTDQFITSANWLDEHLPTRDNRTALLSASLTHQRGSWQRALSMNFLHENFDLGTESGSATVLYPEGAWTYVAADNRIYTMRGMRLLFDVRGTAEALLSDTSFFQTRAQGKWIHRIGSEGRAIARADLGYTALTNITALPASLRFYAGGDQSVRGYAYNSLGPKDAAGDVIGGKYLLVGSLEYEHHLTGRWSAAVFYDAGNAMNTLSGPLEQGAGIGVGWRSPIGLIRVYVASALSRSGNPLRLHVVIGPDL